MPIDRGNVRGLVRAMAYDLSGTRLGRVAQVFLDDRTDEPAWVAVDVTRTRGMRLLPLAGAALKGRHLVIRAQRATVRSAPRIDLSDGQLSSQDEARLLEHYGLRPTAADDSRDTGEHRPASPWPDDTERETAWERPAQQDRDPQGSQDAAPGWGQRPTEPSGIGDRGRIRDLGPAGQAPASGQQRDTAPWTITHAPAPPSEPAMPSGPAQAPPAAPVSPSATSVLPPADSGGGTPSRPDGQSPGSDPGR